MCIGEKIGNVRNIKAFLEILLELGLPIRITEIDVVFRALLIAFYSSAPPLRSQCCYIQGTESVSVPEETTRDVVVVLRESEVWRSGGDGRGESFHVQNDSKV